MAYRYPVTGASPGGFKGKANAIKHLELAAETACQYGYQVSILAVSSHNGSDDFSFIHEGVSTKIQRVIETMYKELICAFKVEDNSVVLVNGSRTVDCRTKPKSHPGNVDMEMSPQLHYQSENTEDASSDSGLAAIVKQELSDNNGPVSNGYYPDLEQPSTVHEPRTAQREEDTSASRGEAWGATSPPKPLRFLLQQSNSVVDQPCYIPKPPALHRAADPTNSPEVGCNTLSPTASGSGTITPATQRVEFRTFENYKCNYCDFTSNTRNGRIMHTRSMHKEKIKRSRRMCKICKDEFANSSNYHRHLRRIHNRNHSLQHCSECNYESADADTFQSHMISTHPSRQPNNFVALPDTHTKIHHNLT